MKKNLILGLIALGSVSMLCGFDSAETASSVYEKANEASKEVISQGFSADITMNADAAINLSDGTNETALAVAGSGKIDADYTFEPFAFSADASMSYSVLGSGEDMSLKYYGVTGDDGVMKMYVYATDPATGEGEWAATALDGVNLNDLIEKAMTADSSMDSSAYGVEFTLAPEAADVNGTECYLLSANMDVSTVSSMLNSMDPTIAQDENVATALALLSGIVLKLDYYIDATTYLPVKMHMDLNSSDLTMVNTMVNAFIGSTASEEAPATTASLVINDVSIDALCSYGNVDAITVPEEALSAPVISMDDITSQLPLE